MRKWEKIFHANGHDRKAGAAILISDKIDVKTIAIKKDKEGHYLMIIESIQEEITIINIYAPNIGALRYIQQILTDIKGGIDGNTIIVGDFNTPFTSMDRSSRQKTNTSILTKICGRYIFQTQTVLLVAFFGTPWTYEGNFRMSTFI